MWAPAAERQVVAKMVTWSPEGKKPNRDDWAKCLILPVGAKGFKPSTSNPKSSVLLLRGVEPSPKGNSSATAATRGTNLRATLDAVGREDVRAIELHLCYKTVNR